VTSRRAGTDSSQLLCDVNIAGLIIPDMPSAAPCSQLPAVENLGNPLLAPSEQSNDRTDQGTIRISFLRATQRVSHKKSLGRGKGKIVKNAHRRNQDCLRGKPEQFE